MPQADIAIDFHKEDNMTERDMNNATSEKEPRFSRRTLMRAAGAAAVLGGLGGVAKWMVYRSPDAPKDFFEKMTIGDNESAVARALAGVIQHQIDAGWSPSSVVPWEAMAISRKGFQIGARIGCEGTIQVLRDVVARLRGTTTADPDLEEAYRRISYPADKWSPFFKANDTVDQLEIGVSALKKYNERLKQGKATYDRRGDSLIAYVKRDSNDFGSMIASLDKTAKDKGILSTEAHIEYYKGLGLLYANYNMYKAIKIDFKEVLQFFTAEQVLDKAISVMSGVSDDWNMPLAVINNTPGKILASHVESLSGGLARVKIALDEITDTLNSKPNASLTKPNNASRIAAASRKGPEVV